MSRSMAWWESSPDSTRRSLCMVPASSGLMSSSSLRVPEGPTSTAGKTRRSAIRRSSLSSALPVPLNSSKITVSPADPVSTTADAMIVSEPPYSMLRAAPRDVLGAYRAVASTTPDGVRPEGFLGRVQGGRVGATGEDPPRGRRGVVVRTAQAGDGVEEDHHVLPHLHQSLGALDTEFCHLGVVGRRAVEGRGEHLALHRPLHVRDLFGPLVHE